MSRPGERPEVSLLSLVEKPEATGAKGTVSVGIGNARDVGRRRGKAGREGELLTASGRPGRLFGEGRLRHECGWGRRGRGGRAAPEDGACAHPNQGEERGKVRTGSRAGVCWAQSSPDVDGDGDCAQEGPGFLAHTPGPGPWWACAEVTRDAPSSRRLSPHVHLWDAHVETSGRRLETGIRSYVRSG